MIKVAVVGAGKMGLPLAAQFARRGADVTACDRNLAVVDAINAGRCPIDEPGIEAIVEDTVARGVLRATEDTAAAAAEAEVIVVIVPALLTNEMDIDTSLLVAASRAVAEGLQRGAMVSCETTLPVGGMRRFIIPALERRGLRAGVDFDAVFSPERVKSQRVLKHLEDNAKVVGGITPAAAERGTDFYARYLGAPVVNVGSLEAAEMVKVAGMVYRDVNIALANELAGYAQAVGLDLPSLLPAINSDGEAHLLAPGIGVGGHCTPVYPYFMIRDAERLDVPFGLAARAREVNDGGAARALDTLEASFGPIAGLRVAVLGLGFRPQVKETACATAFLVDAELRSRGATSVVVDPLFTHDEIRACGLTPGTLDGGDIDVAVLCTAHEAFAGPDWEKLHGLGLRAVVDGRNAWPAEEIRRAGLHYQGVGRPLAPASRPVALTNQWR